MNPSFGLTSVTTTDRWEPIKGGSLHPQNCIYAKCNSEGAAKAYRTQTHEIFYHDISTIELFFAETKKPPWWGGFFSKAWSGVPVLGYDDLHNTHE